MTGDGLILSVNGGSSTIRYAVHTASEPLKPRASGKVEGADGAAKLIATLESHLDFAAVTAIGHRVVHGMKRLEPALVTPDLIGELRKLIPFDPEHLPHEIELIEAFGRRFEKVPQVACFDTAFHGTLPQVARLLPIPRRFAEQGVVRYGFHGLSYAYLVEELGRLAGDAAKGRVILAHLGNGASLCAVRGGQSIDTTMGFTPAGGIPMGTRTGNLDPGVASWLLSEGGLDARAFSQVVNHESGLLGVSETSSDMRALLKSAPTDIRAAEAVKLFCYEVRKAIGAYAAALGGVETLVFAGGIGENSPEVRARICNGLQFLGIELNETANQGNAGVISDHGALVTVRVIPTNEELMIARLVCRFRASNSGG